MTTTREQLIATSCVAESKSPAAALGRATATSQRSFHADSNMSNGSSLIGYRTEECKQGHGGKDACDDSFEQRKRVSAVDDERPLHDGESEAHDEVSGSHEVQAVQRQSGCGGRCFGCDAGNGVTPVRTVSTMVARWAGVADVPAGRQGCSTGDLEYDMAGSGPLFPVWKGNGQPIVSMRMSRRLNLPADSGRRHTQKSSLGRPLDNRLGRVIEIRLHHTVCNRR